MTYYGVRFGLILPARLLTAIFGPEIGYFVLRYLLSLVFGVPLYAVCKRYLSTAVAVVVYAIAVGTPYFARALLWDHPDASGVPFLTAGICLFLLDRPRSSLRSFLAGCCAAMAVHSNVFTLALFGIFVLTYSGCCLLDGQGRIGVLRQIVLAAFGAVLVTFAGALYYGFTVGHFDIFSVTISTVVSLSRGGLLVWRVPGAAWTLIQYHVFIPVWLAVCGLIIVGFRRPPFFASVVMCYGLGITAFYYVHQFLLDGDTLQLYYYFSYAAPAVFLMLALLFQYFYDRAAKPPAVFVGVVLVVVFIPLLALSYGAAYTRFVHFELFAVPAFAVWVLIAMMRLAGGKAFRRVLGVVGIVLIAASFDLGFAGYGYMIQNRAAADTAEVDVYRVALQFIKAMPEFSGDAGDLLFLYDNRHQSLDSIQSTYLWGYSSVKYDRGAGPGHPSLEPAEVARLKQTALYVGLIGESADEVEFEAQDLRSHNIPFRQLDQRTISSGSYKIYWRLLEVSQVPRTALVNGDFESGTAPWAGGWATLRTVGGGQSGKCLELEGERGDSQFAMEWNALKLKPGSNYRLLAWVKSGSSGDERFRVGLWDSRENRWVAYRDGTATGAWIQYTIDFTAASSHVLSCELMKNSRTKGSMLFDSVEIVPRD
ncbi:MAG: carbohydrate binding domain-containing protein [Bryobacteraceae bacterium]